MYFFSNHVFFLLSCVRFLCHAFFFPLQSVLISVFRCQYPWILLFPGTFSDSSTGSSTNLWAASASPILAWLWRYQHHLSVIEKREKKKKHAAGIFITDLYVCSSDTEHEPTKRYFITLWRSDPSKCDIIILPLLYFYVYYYYYENIQSHKGNQIQSLTLVNTKPPHKSNTSSYQLMYVGPHSKHRKNPQINSQSRLEWNVSHWDCSPGQSFPAFRLPITLCTRV